MNLPQVFVAGFPRCGTTWIARLLNQHPEIHAPMKKHPKYPYLVKKEIHYLNRTPSNLNDLKSLNQGFNRNITEYTHFFQANKINIDFSICSAYDLNSAYLVQEILGNVKILFFIRDKEEHRESLKVLTGQEPSKELLDLKSAMKPYNIFSNTMVINLAYTEKFSRNVLKDILKFIGAKDVDFKFDFSGSKHSSEEIKKYNV